MHPQLQPRSQPQPHPQPRPQPRPLTDLMIQVGLRQSSQGLADSAISTTLIPPSTLLREKFKSMATKDIRCHHLSWEALCIIVRQDFSINFDPCKDELGWVQAPPQPDIAEKFITITDELTFQNAIGVLYNASLLEPTLLISLYLWSPKRMDTILHHQPPRSTNAPEAMNETSDSLANNETSSTPLNDKGDLDLALPLQVASSEDSSAPMAPPRPEGDQDTDKASISEVSKVSADKEEDIYGVSPPRNALGDKPAMVPSEEISDPVSPDNMPAPLSPSDPKRDQNALTASQSGSTPPIAVPENQGSIASHPEETPFDVNRLLHQELKTDVSALEQEEDEEDDDFQIRMREYQEQLAENEMNRYAAILGFILLRLLMLATQTPIWT